MGEQNKYLTEAMGDCWHDWDGKTSWSVKDMCRCGAHPACHLKPPNFSTWEGFGKLWAWARKQDWWDVSFIYDMIEDDSQKGMVYEELINPENFARAVVDFLQKKNKIVKE